MSAKKAALPRSAAATTSPARRSCARPRVSWARSISSERTLTARGRQLCSGKGSMTDDKDLKELKVPDVIAILPLRGTVLFPHAVVPLAAGRTSSVQAIEEAVRGGRLVGAVMQRDPADNTPNRAGLHDIGTLAL